MMIKIRKGIKLNLIRNERKISKINADKLWIHKKNITKQKENL